MIEISTLAEEAGYEHAKIGQIKILQGGMVDIDLIQLSSGVVKLTGWFIIIIIHSLLPVNVYSLRFRQLTN